MLAEAAADTATQRQNTKYGHILFPADVYGQPFRRHRVSGHFSPQRQAVIEEAAVPRYAISLLFAIRRAHALLH